MGWFVGDGRDEAITARKRIPISVYNSAGAGGLAIEVSIRAVLDDLWDFLIDQDPDFDQIAVGISDGSNDTGHEWSSVSKTLRTGSLLIGSASAGSDLCPLDALAGMHIIWLYYDFETTLTNKYDVTYTSFTKDVDGIIHYTDPSSSPGAIIVEAAPSEPGQTEPNQTVTKQSSDNIIVWWRVRPYLEQAGGLVTPEGSTVSEEVKVFVSAIEDSGGTPTTGTMADDEKCRVYESPDGELYIGMYVTGGTDGQDYILKPALHTILPLASGLTDTYRILTPTCRLQVRDIAV